METNNNRNVMMLLPLLIVFITLLSILSQITSTSTLVASSLFMKRVIDIVACLSLLSSVLYIISGFKKESSKFFKLFLYTFALLKLISLLDLTMMHIDYKAQGEPLTPHMIMMNVLLLVVVILLIFLLIKKDIGKKTSLIMSSIILFIHFVYFLFPIIMRYNEDWTLGVIIRWFTGVALSLVLIFMQLLKYHDKEERNTK